ncbi:MAG: RidA family protein [Planctomycetota bacterium]
MDADQRFAELNLELPPPPAAVGVYQPGIITGNLCFTSGHLPILPDGSLLTGCVGKDIDEQAGRLAARQAGLAILATIKQEFGSLNRVDRVIKLFGFVNCSDEFTGQPKVMNGCSELFKSVFGDENGIGARSAVGTNSLPLGVIVEIEAIFEISEG